MRIKELEKYRRRQPGGYFDDLPWEIQKRAEQWLHYFCDRWKRRGLLTHWRFAILVGQARRLAWTTPEIRSAWGRSRRAKKGGLAVQRRYRLEGRNPTARATHASKWIRKARKRQREEALERARLGLPEPSRHGFTNMVGI